MIELQKQVWSHLFQSIGQYWPSSPSDIMVIDKYTVSEIGRETTEDYIIRELSLKVMKEDDDPESEPEVSMESLIC